MKNFLRFLFFICYTISIFFIDDYGMLAILFIVNLLLTFVLELPLKNLLYNLKILFPFILFTVIVNIIFDSVYFGILIGFRLLMCYHITYLFSKSISIRDFAGVIEKLFFPLKLFGVNTKNIKMIVSISLCMVPVLKNEIGSIINSFKSKGQLVNVHSLVIISKPMIISLFRRTSAMEKTLISKGYEI